MFTSLLKVADEAEAVQDDPSRLTLRLHSIRIEGFKVYSSPTEVRPLRPFNCIIGPNGIGKSVLGEAIAFALGANARMLRVKTLSGVISTSPDEGGEPLPKAEVALAFNVINTLQRHVSGRLYVRRHVRQSGRSALFQIAGDAVVVTSPQSNTAAAAEQDDPDSILPRKVSNTSDNDAEIIDEEIEDVDQLEKIEIDTGTDDYGNEEEPCIPSDLVWKDISQKDLASLLLTYGLDINTLDRVIVTQHRRAVDVADPKKLVKFIETLIGGGGAAKELEMLTAEYVAAEEENSRLDDAFDALMDKSVEFKPALEQWERFNKSKLEYFERLAAVCKKKAVLLEKEAVVAGKEAEEAEKKLEGYEHAQEAARIKADELLVVKEDADVVAAVAVAQQKESVDAQHAALEQLERAQVRENAAAAAARRASSSLGTVAANLRAENNLEKKKGRGGKGGAGAAALKVKERLETKAETLENEVTAAREELESLEQEVTKLKNEESSDEPTISAKVVAARKAWQHAQEKADAATATAQTAAEKAVQASQAASTAVSDLEKKEHVESEAEKAVDMCNTSMISLEKRLVALEEEAKKVQNEAEKAEKELAAYESESSKLENALEKAAKALKDAGIDENDSTYVVPLKNNGGSGGGGGAGSPLQSVDAAVAALAQQAQHDELNPLTSAFHGRIHSVLRVLSPQALPAVNAVLLEKCNPVASLVVSTRTAAEAVVGYFKDNKVGVASCIVLEELCGSNSGKAATEESAAKLLASVLNNTRGSLCPLSSLIQANADVAGSSLLCADLFENWYLVFDPLAAAQIREQEKKDAAAAAQGGGGGNGKKKNKKPNQPRQQRNLVTLCGSVFKSDGEICAPKEETFLKSKEKYVPRSDDYVEIGSTSFSSSSGSSGNSLDKSSDAEYEQMVEKLRAEYHHAAAAVDFHELNADEIYERTAAMHALLNSKNAAIAATRTKFEGAIKTMQKESKVLATARAAVEKARIGVNAATTKAKTLETASLEAKALAKKCVEESEKLHQIYIITAHGEPAAQRALEKEQTLIDLRTRSDTAEKRKLALEKQLTALWNGISRLDKAIQTLENVERAGVESTNKVSEATLAVAEHHAQQTEDLINRATATKKEATENWRDAVENHQSALQAYQQTLAVIQNARHRQEAALSSAIQMSKESVDALEQVTSINEKTNSACVALSGIPALKKEEEMKKNGGGGGGAEKEADDEDEDEYCNSTSSSDVENEQIDRKRLRGSGKIPAVRSGGGGGGGDGGFHRGVKKSTPASSPALPPAAEVEKDCSSSDGAVSIAPMESTESESEWEEDGVTSAFAELSIQNRELEYLARSLDATAVTEAIQVHSQLILVYTELQTQDNKLQRLATRLAEARTARYTRFSTAMDAAAKHLSKIYGRLTGKIGDASCYYSQNEHTCFEEGVKFKVRPDTGSWRMFASLSGGQQALAALSLCFAFQKISPSPFYFFDEIDAALDAVTSQRVADFLRDTCEGSISSSTNDGTGCVGPQIIAVSHRAAPQEAAHCLLAVYPIQQHKNHIRTGIMTLHPSSYYNEYDLILQETGEKRLVRLDGNGGVHWVDEEDDVGMDDAFIRQMLEVLGKIE